MTNVFVVNTGSSSIKYQLIDVEGERVLASGLLERVGEQGSEFPDHEAGLRKVLEGLDPAIQIAAVGHRVVHGADRFTEPTVLGDAEEAAIDELSVLAPLHNPPNLAGIRAARAALPDVPHVAVFDTAFHATLEPAAYTYAIDAALAAKHRIRRYGFHGTSHKYVAGKAAELLGRPIEELRIIVLHLGNGASVAAVRGGVSIDTSMGMTPVQGLVMGTRSGDIDPAVLVHLHRQEGLNVDQLDELVNRQSGLLGMTGSGDMRDVQAAASDGDPVAEAALAVYRHRIRHYLGAYTAQLGGLDAVVFTAGVGENNSALRRRVLSGLDFLGLQVDDDRNELASKAPRFISPEGAPVAALVIPTNEELEIARQTASVLAGLELEPKERSAG